MPNQFSRNTFFHTLTQTNKPTDVTERTYKRKIYKRLKRLKKSLETATGHDLLYVFDETNYSDHKPQEITVMNKKYNSIMLACEANYKENPDHTLEEWYIIISARLRKLKSTSEKVSTDDIDKRFIDPLRKVKKKPNSFAALAKKHNRPLNTSQKQFTLLKKRIDIEADEYFELTKEQIAKIMLEPQRTEAELKNNL